MDTTEALTHAAPIVSKLVLGKLVEAAKDAYAAYQQEKGERWWKELVELLQLNSEGGVKELEQRLCDYNSRNNTVRTVTQSYKTLLDSTDDAVISSLAVLTAEYIAHPGKNPDQFFRGM